VATSSHVFTQSPQKVAVESGIHSLACWDRCFALPHLLHTWRYQSGIFWILPRIGNMKLYCRQSLIKMILHYGISYNTSSEYIQRTLYKEWSSSVTSVSYKTDSHSACQPLMKEEAPFPFSQDLAAGPRAQLDDFTPYPHQF
jgi:hypothetical protein